MITEVKRDAEGIRAKIAQLDDADELAQILGPKAITYYQAARRTCQWALGEAPSPIYGYHLNDENFNQEWDFAYRAYRIWEADGPARQAEFSQELHSMGLSDDYVLAVFRTLRWLRSTPTNSYAELYDPIPWR